MSDVGRRKVALNLYLEPRVASVLGELAAERGISRSKVVERAIKALPMVEALRRRWRQTQARKKQKHGNNHAGV